MRAFQFITITLFLLFYIYISWGALKSLRGIVESGKNKHWISLACGLFSLSLFVAFILLYIWPFNARNVNDYKYHFIFNAILSIDFIFKIPLSLSFLVGLFIPKAKRAITYFTGLILAIGCSTGVLYGSLFGKNELAVKHVNLEFNKLPDSFDGFIILQFSDLHLGSYMNSNGLINDAAFEIEAIHPDLILFTGDLVNNFSYEINGREKAIHKITENHICYSILGNHDYGNYFDWKNINEKLSNFNEIVASHQKLGMQILNNKHAIVKKGKDSIYIIGVENWGHPPFPQYAKLDSALLRVPDDAFKILLSHDPAHWEEVVKNRSDIDLTLSGHTHGFQWGMSYAGIRFSLAYLARKNWAGIYKFNNSQLYVNTGMGMVGIPWRINMPAEITSITLKRSKID